jgi:hypothetical protein
MISERRVMRYDQHSDEGAQIPMLALYRPCGATISLGVAAGASDTSGTFSMELMAGSPSPPNLCFSELHSPRSVRPRGRR